MSFYENAQNSYLWYLRLCFFLLSIKTSSPGRETSVSELFHVRVPSFPGNCIGNCQRRIAAVAAAESPPSFRFVSFCSDSIPTRIEKLLFQIWVRIVKRSPIRGRVAVTGKIDSIANRCLHCREKAYLDAAIS